MQQVTCPLSGSKSDVMSFLKATYQLFAGSLLAATTGAYISIESVAFVTNWFWGLIILEFVLLFALFNFKKVNGLNLLILFSFTFVTGLTLGPILARFLSIQNGASIIGQAFAMTTVAFGGISMFAMTTKKDYSSLGKILFISLIILIIGGIFNIFFHSPIFHVVLSAAGAIIFSLFILYDTQQIIKGNFETPIEAAVALYLDFLNLFINLLQILGIFSSSDD